MTYAKRTPVYSASITVFLWLLATLAIIFIPLKSQPEKQTYPTVKISLSTQNTPKIEPKNSAVSDRAVSENLPAVQTPPVRQTIPRQNSPETRTPQPVRAVETPVPRQENPAPQVLAPDLTTINTNQTMQTAPKKTEWPSDAEWITQSTPRTQTAPDAQTPRTQAPASPPIAQFEGTAAQVAQTTNTGAQSASVSRTQTAQNTTPAEQTTGALKRISEATYSNNGETAGISYETALQAVAKTESGGLEMQMRDGSTRRLLDPQEPAIMLSSENEKLIDSSKRVMIQFRVLAAGTVPLNSITFSPSGLLPISVQEDVRAQISRWRFETSQSDGQAAFQYSIKKE